MKIHAITLVAAALLVAGCTEKSERGGPGVKTGDGKSATNTSTTTTKSANGNGKSVEKTTTTTTHGGDQVVDKAKTFVVSKPLTDTNIEQGESDDVTVSIDRGSDFKQKVTLQFKPPAGVTVTPPNGTIAPDAKDMKILVKAAPDAAVGKHNIEVTATPENGKPVTTQLAIDIKKKG